MTDEPEILFEQRGALGFVTLNRPKALNALTHEMALALHKKLDVWADDGAIRSVAIVGAGERAFCAGGDIRTLYESGKAGTSYAREFYRDEYLLNAALKRYDKPIVSFISGFVMGGGVGVSVHGSHRIADETTVFAMPETGIGLFPDVGGSYFLPRMPGALGMYIGLTGVRVKDYDALYCGMATHFKLSRGRGEVLQYLIDGEPASSVLAQIPGWDAEHAAYAERSTLRTQREKIDTIFAADSVEGILERLERDGTDWALDTAKMIRAKSPTATKLAFRQIREGASKDFENGMRMEFRMVNRVIAGHDFYEGVRATIIDKDGAPKWSPATLAEVSDADIDAYFKPLDEELPLPRALYLKAGGWKTALDVIAALKIALDSPHGHGGSIDAFIDSMVYGSINGVEAPYTIDIIGESHAGADARAFLADLVAAIAEQDDKQRIVFKIAP
ncbi:MAG TPA: enoyl-CoA hydratase/isomerase family protein [Rhizomicrobium sp.]|jgi:enoyl-CoA hydratase|nr:enoyl-CoA hydratase/isomerase family protein [Rhizomicrobium sp.]